ncbi:MAG: tetratricopeptide repeat protein [Natronosporangium sp.]
MRHSPAGYALVAAPDQVDIYRFAELTHRGHAALAAGDQLAARDLLREALALCRGPAFQGLDDIPSLATEAEHLAELRLVAIEGRIAAELAQGEHMSVVAELRQLVADHPLRERLRAQLMTALYRAGRKADALAIFRDGRRILVEELVRTHATSTALDQDAEHERRAALTRLLDHYRHSATVAMDVAYPYERERRPDVPPADTPTPALPDPARALGWLDVELPNLLAAAQHAADAGWPAHTGHLSAILHRHLRTRGRYHEAEQLHHRALTATAGTVGEIDASNGLGWIYRLRGWHDLAIGHFAAALDRARAIGHRAGELDALNGLGSVHLRQGRHDLAIGRFAATLEVARAVGHRAGELDAVIGLGCVHRRQGRYDLATDYLNQGLQAARATDNRVAELQALRDLGTIHRFHGRHRQAAEHYARMLEIALLTGNPAGELDARNRLGNAYRAQGRYRQAVEHYARLLEIARGTGSRTAELVAMLDLGHTYLMQGKHPAAAAAYQHALDIGHEIGDRDGRFEALQGLGRLHHATGQPDLALAHHQQALELATDLQQPPTRPAPTTVSPTPTMP